MSVTNKRKEEKREKLKKRNREEFDTGSKQ